MYYALEKADLIDYSEDRSHAYPKRDNGIVNIDTKIKISGTNVVKDSEETGGIDDWQPGDGDDPVWIEF